MQDFEKLSTIKEQVMSLSGKCTKQFKKKIFDALSLSSPNYSDQHVAQAYIRAVLYQHLENKDGEFVALVEQILDFESNGLCKLRLSEKLDLLYLLVDEKALNENIETFDSLGFSTF